MRRASRGVAPSILGRRSPPRTHDPADAVWSVAVDSGLPVVLWRRRRVIRRTMNVNPHIYRCRTRRLRLPRGAHISPRCGWDCARQDHRRPGHRLRQAYPHRQRWRDGLRVSAVPRAGGAGALLGASRKKLIDHISDVPAIPPIGVPGSPAAALAGVSVQGVVRSPGRTSVSGDAPGPQCVARRWRGRTQRFLSVLWPDRCSPCRERLSSWLRQER